VKDLHDALKTTEKIIDELDEKIHAQSDKSFRDINRAFQHFFKILFGGGVCELIRLTREDLQEEETEETDVALERAMADTAEVEREHEEETLKKPASFHERADRVVGIDIHATPPGKKLKALNLLSGGERALTAIALVSAIMATNPAPFVVLDEVDAALDEANTLRFAAILEELAKLTQFIVVTHNRATMEKADVLYGVTMGDDGVSNLLSVKLEEIKKNGTSRR
jgi:chromosome segregation protein